MTTRRWCYLLALTLADGLVPAPRARKAPAHNAAVQEPAPAPFTKDFTRPIAIPEEGVAAAVEVLRSGRLFRYSAASADTSLVAQAELEFAALVGQRYVVGVNSGASALVLALLAAGVSPGDHVVTNGFAFTAVPSAVMRLGAEPVLVETTMNWTMDLDDLEAKLDAYPEARVLLLSHAIGKVCDMDRVLRVCELRSLALVEDCSQACGVTWAGRPVGSFGVASAYSTQSDNVINSGEGGFVTTNDDEIAAKLIYLSGCYERRYGKHASRPPDELCEAAMLEMPNLSSRMSEVAAACVIPLVKSLPERVSRYNMRYAWVVNVLRANTDAIVVPDMDPLVGAVHDRLQFRFAGIDDEENALFRTTCVAMGVPVSWFRSQVNARWHQNWRRYGAPAFELPKTDKALRFAYDLKLPPYLDDDDFPHLAEVIAYAANAAKNGEE